MTIRALQRLVLLSLSHLVCDGRFEVVTRALFRAIEGITVTRSAGEDGNVRVFHRFGVGILRDADVTGHAVLQGVVLLRVIELDRIAVDRIRLPGRLCQRVTSGAVAAHGFYTREMTSKACLVSEGHRLEI